MEEWRLRRGAGARMTDKLFPVLLKGSRYADRLPIGKTEIIQSVQAGAAEAVLHGLVPAGSDGRRRRRRLRQGRGRDADQDALRVDPGAGVAAAAPDVRRARSCRHRATRSTTDKEMTDRRRSRSTTLLPAREQGTVGVYRQKTVDRLFSTHAVRAVRGDRAEARRAVHAWPASAAAASSPHARTKRRWRRWSRTTAIERGLEALVAEAERVARFGFTATELDRQKQAVLRNYERLADRERTTASRRAAPTSTSATSSTDETLPTADDEYALHQRFLPTITLDEINKIAQGMVRRPQPHRHRHRAGEARARRCRTKRSWRPCDQGRGREGADGRTSTPSASAALLDAAPTGRRGRRRRRRRTRSASPSGSCRTASRSCSSRRRSRRTRSCSARPVPAARRSRATRTTFPASTATQRGHRRRPRQVQRDRSAARC